MEGYEDPFDTAHLLELLKKESERVEVEENGVVRFTSVKFYLTDQNSRLSITAANPPTSVSFGKSRSPEETAAYMSAFNDAMPDIHRYIEEEIATRYWFQEAGVKVRLRYDKQLKNALEKTVNIN